MALARWISILGHPFVTVAAMVIGSGATGDAAPHPHTATGAARGLAMILLITVLPVAILMVRQVRRGAWANVDASDRRERPLLYAVCAAGVITLLIYLGLTQPRSSNVRGAWATLTMLAVCAFATRWLKVSLHMAFAAFATTTLLLLGSTIGWILLAALPPLAWSRLFLSRHRPAEVIAGGAIGLAAGLALYAL